GACGKPTAPSSHSPAGSPRRLTKRRQRFPEPSGAPRGLVAMPLTMTRLILVVPLLLVAGGCAARMPGEAVDATSQDPVMNLEGGVPVGGLPIDGPATSGKPGPD